MKQISLRAARIDAGLTQKQAAEQIGVSNVALANWESGKTSPLTKHFVKACEIYGFDTNDIFLPMS